MLVECRPYQYGTMLVVPVSKVTLEILGELVGRGSDGSAGLFQQSEDSISLWLDLMSSAKRKDYDLGWDVVVRVDDTLFWLLVKDFLLGSY